MVYILCYSRSQTMYLFFYTYIPIFVQTRLAVTEIVGII